MTAIIIILEIKNWDKKETNNWPIQHYGIPILNVWVEVVKKKTNIL